jgi:thiosulfate dehydrogenase [quinone] large subunit
MATATSTNSTTSAPGRWTNVDARLMYVVLAAARIFVAFLWIQNVGWKTPAGGFGQDSGGTLYGYVVDGITHPVLAPYASILSNVVLPHFLVFAWLTLIVEMSIGAFLLVGLATRLFALIGAAQAIAIGLSLLNTPGEWHWSYYLLVIGQLFIFATAAGRYAGVDGVLRPRWAASRNPLARLLMVAS